MSEAIDRGSTVRLKSAAFFLVVLWAAVLATGHFLELGETLVALAIAWVVPLGVALGLPTRTAAGRQPLHIDVVVALGAPFGVASFLFKKGPISGAFAAVWVATTLAIALSALSRVARRGLGPIEEAAVDVGHLYLPIGAIWLFASRAEISLLGFHEPVVLYTAAHFHFAGFAAPLIVGMLGRELFGPDARPSPRLRWLYVASTVVVLLGIPLVAAGIQLTHALEMPSAMVLGAGMLGAASLLIVAGVRRVAEKRSRLSGALLGLSGMSLVFSMSLAILFTTTGSATRGAAAPLIPYSLMAELHGIANAVGFASLAILAFTIVPPPPSRVLGGSWPTLFGTGFVGPDFFERVHAIDETRSVHGQLGSLDDFASPGFAPSSVDRRVRDFYERTEAYELVVTPEWHMPFRLMGRAFGWFARRFLGQLELPTRPEGEEHVATRLFAVRDALDGRTDVRGYVRAYGSGERSRANYVAAYSTHASAERLLLSAAFPLPFAALVGVLRFENGPEGAGLALSSEPLACGSLDEGMFLVTRLGPFRLPVRERIEVWPSGTGAPIRASHRVWVLGLRCFTLAYSIDLRPTNALSSSNAVPS